jgi:hypothetical protein
LVFGRERERERKKKEKRKKKSKLFCSKTNVPVWTEMRSVIMHTVTVINVLLDSPVS